MFRAIVIGTRFKGDELTVLPGFVAGMFVTIGLDEHHLHGNICLDLYRDRIILVFDVDRVRADFIVTPDNIEDLVDLGRGSGIIGARRHDRQSEESEGKGNCSHNDHRFCGLLARLNSKSACIETKSFCLMVCRMALYKVKPTVACMIRRSNFLFFKAKITCEARGVDPEFR
jgi:hypothetical protein